MPTRPPQALRGVRVLSLALNLPGPAALLRLRQMGARCTKLEPPGRGGSRSGDPMSAYQPGAYEALHEGISVLSADLKTDEGQATLHKLLRRTDVLLTSFRPSALNKLGLGWKKLHQQYPTLSLVRIVGAPGERAEEPGHDLTYLADAGLVTDLSLPATLFADMGGSLMASEAALQAVLLQRTTGRGSQHEVALSQAAHWLALPRHWGLTMPEGAVGGAHAGYRVYPCRDGRVAVAALEPHFAVALCEAAGVAGGEQARTLFSPATHQAIADFLGSLTREQLDALARERDIPMHTLA